MNNAQTEPKAQEWMDYDSLPAQLQADKALKLKTREDARRLADQYVRRLGDADTRFPAEAGTPRLTVHYSSLRRLMAERDYAVSDKPTLCDTAPLPPEKQALLLALYDAVGANWRQLVDVRFKLLALVPTLTGLALIPLLSHSKPGEGLSDLARLGIAVLGLAVTYGLRVYDRRNTQLHDDLISRGRRIEEELGVHTGPFLGRKKHDSWIEHDRAIGLIYGAALLGWALTAALSAATIGAGWHPFR